MFRVQAALLVLLTVLWVANVEVDTAQAEEVVVTSETASIKVKDRVIGEVRQGDRLEVLARRGGWVAVAVETDRGTKRGWVLANHLQSQTDERETAPEAPSAIAPGVDLKVDSLQVYLQSDGGFLFLRVAIENAGDSEFAFDESSIHLLVDGEAVKPGDGRPVQYSSARIYTGFGSQTTPSLRFRYSRDLEPLGKGVVAPGQSAEGWLKFPLTGIRRGTDISDTSFLLAGRLGDADFKFDLRELAVDNLSPRLRASTFDPSVNVAELAGGLNALNFPALRKLLELDADSRPRGVAVVKTDSFFLDQFLLDQFRSTTYAPGSPSKAPLVGFVLNEARQAESNVRYAPSMYVQGLPLFKSETEAVISELAARPNAVEILSPHLQHVDTGVRAAACSGLARHLGDAKAVETLIAAASDEDPAVRSAAALALGGFSQAYPGNSYRRVDSAAAATPEVVETLLAAMKDEATSVRVNAARTASRVPHQELIDGLVVLLQDQEQSVVSVACSSLGSLQAKSAVEALKELRQSEDIQRRSMAIRALGAIGELSPIEMALAQLTEGTPDYNDFDTLLKAKDERAVEPLIRYLKGQNTNTSYVDRAARALGSLGDKRATEVLVAHLRYGNQYSSEVPEALGELGDPAAIAPLREVLTGEGSSTRRGAIYGALARLNAEGTLDELKEMLQKPDSARLNAGEIFKAIGSSQKEEATILLASFLDDQRHHRYAIDALILQETDAAFDAIKKRLLAADYPYGSTILSVLRSKQSEQAVALIRAAVDSENADTRRSAEAYVSSIDGGASQRARLHQALIGNPYSPFTAEHWINGSELTAEDLKNKVVLLDFWAVWCGPCIATFPHLRQWHEEYGDQGLEIIGITRHYKYGWNDETNRPVRDVSLKPEDENKALESFVKHHELKHRIAVVSSDSTTSADYRVSGIPQAVLIDRAGKIRLIKVGSGEANAKAIEEEIQRALRELDLGGQSLTDEEIKGYLSDAAEITSLNLQGTKVDDGVLESVKDLKQLQTLRLDGTVVSDEGLRLLADQGTLSGLKELGLSGTNVTEAGLSMLAELSSLEALSIATPGLDDQSLQMIGKIKSLRQLDLGDGWGAASITDEGLQHLAGLNKLERLDLHGTAITDQGLRKLPELSALQTIGLVETKVTSQGVDWLRSARSDLDVRIDQWSPWLSRSDYQTHFGRMQAKKYFPLQVEGRSGDDGPLYRGRFVPHPTGREFVFRSMHAADYADYTRRRSEAQRDGLQQVSLFSFQDGSFGELFNGTWVHGRVEAYWKTPTLVANRALTAAARAARDGDLESAARTYREALDAQPENFRAQVFLGHSLWRLGQQQAAQEAYERAIQLLEGIAEERRTTAEWGFLGQALYRLDRWLESRAAFERVIEVRGEDKPVVADGPRWWYLTMILHRMGEQEKAAEYLRELSSQLTEDATGEQVALRREAAQLIGKLDPDEPGTLGR